VVAVEVLLREHRARLAVAEVARRAADELRDLVRVLELGAVDLNHRVGVAEEDFRRGLDDARLARPRGAEEEHRADGAVRRVHPGEEDLVEAAHAAHGALLPHDARGQLLLKLLRAGTLLVGVEQDGVSIDRFSFH
jgi:hypothetical protein